MKMKVNIKLYVIEIWYRTFWENFRRCVNIKLYVIEIFDNFCTLDISRLQVNIKLYVIEIV